MLITGLLFARLSMRTAARCAQTAHTTVLIAKRGRCWHTIFPAPTKRPNPAVQAERQPAPRLCLSLATDGTGLAAGWNFDSSNKKLRKLFLFCRASGAVSGGQS